MTLRSSLARALSTREQKSNTSTGAPSLAGLFGFKKEPQSSRIIALREALSIPVSDPTLADVLSSLPPGLRRGRNSRSSDLCSMHANLSIGPLMEITNLLTYELHRRLAHLYQFPRIHLSLETRTHLYETLRPYRIYFREQPSIDADRKGDGESAIGTTCLACTLSLFFRDETAVEALAVCAKSRRHRGTEWSPLLDWLEPGKKKKGWEERWRWDGQSVRRDRRKAQLWRRCCRENGENEDAFLSAVDNGKFKEKDYEEEEEEEPSSEYGRFEAWVHEQKERAARFSAERNRSGQEPTYTEIDLPSNPFTDSHEHFRLNPFADSHEHHLGDEGENSPDRTSHPAGRMDHDQEQEYERRRSESQAQAYKALTGSTLTGSTLIGSRDPPEDVAQISESEYEPPAWRRRH